MIKLQVNPDGSEIVRLTDGREVTLIRLSSDTQSVIFQNNEIGTIQRMHRLGETIVYIVTEWLSKDKSQVFLEHEAITPLSQESEKIEAYLKFREKHRWILSENGGEEVMQKLFDLCPDIYPLDEFFKLLGKKNAGDRSGAISMLMRLINLVENPEIRDIPNNRNFWNKKCLPVLGQLGIKLK